MYPGGEAQDPTMAAQPMDNSIAEEPTLEDTPELLVALIKRKRRDISIKLSPEERKQLAERIRQDMYDAGGSNSNFRDNHVEFLNNWRGTPEPPNDDHPLGEMAANIKVPLTSTYTEQWKARLGKIVIGDGNMARFYSLVENLEEGVLKKLSDWFNWELINVVKISKVINTIMHYVLIDGFCLSVPCYKIVKRTLCSAREFDFNPDQPLATQIENYIHKCFGSLGYTVETITPTTKVGVYEVDVKDIDKLAIVTCLLDEGMLVLELEYEETTFDGVEVQIPDTEDIVVMNTAPDVEDIPFLGLRGWLSSGQFEEEFEQDKWPEITREDIKPIMSFAGPKTQEIIPMQTSDELDIVEGGDSRGESYALGNDKDRQWLEIYRWEGYIKYKGKRTGVAAWITSKGSYLLRICRLEELNKDGKRSCVKHQFIPVPGRFYSMGLCELLRHVQTEMDGIHNFRLDSALVATVPFGFYEPTAGAPHTIIGLRPGSLYPVKRAAGILFPKLGWNSVWGFNEEGLVRKYGSELAGMGDPGTGTFASKRTSASEFLGTTQALDIRTEHIANQLLEDIEELLYRIFGLYQQHSHGKRVFMMAGADGKMIMDEIHSDLFQGRIRLQLMGSLKKLSPQIEKELAMQMLSVLVNPFAIQMGITKPDTVYKAIAKIMEAGEYKGVPIYEPQTEPDSPPPDKEHAMMAAGMYPEPHIGENFGMHLQSHLMLAQNPKIDELMSPQAQAFLQQHIEESMRLYQQVAIIQQQQAIQAQAMQANMATMGVRPGQQGGTSGEDAANAGSAQEGVQSPQASQEAT